MIIRTLLIAILTCSILLLPESKDTMAAPQSPYISIVPTNVDRFYKLWFNDCSNVPSGAEVMVLVYDCEGNPIESRFWKPCDPPSIIVGTGESCIVKYIMTIPLLDGSRKVIESNKISIQCP